MENRYTTDYEFQSRVQTALTGALPEAEQAALSAQLANDTAAQEEYGFSKNLTLALNNQDLFAVSALMSQIITEEGLPIPENTPPQYDAPKSAIASAKTWIWGLLAVLLVSIGAYSIIEVRKNAQKTQGAQLAQQYLQPLENNLNTDTPLNGLNDLNEGMSAYNAKDYRKAAPLLGKHYRFTHDANAGLYYGVSLLMMDESIEEVSKVLLAVTPQLNEPMRHDAEWYYTLALLKAGKLSEAKAYLPKIADNSPYKKAANTLLDDLKD